MSETAVQPMNQSIRIWGLRIALIACLPLVLLGVPVWGAGVMQGLKVLGTLMLIAGVLYRFWAILYIGGRKNATVVQDGPYSMSRHPLYFGTCIAALGFGLMLGSLLLAALFGTLALVVLTATAVREERYLRAEFGADYEAFSARVRHRVVPQPGLFTTPEDVSFKPRILRSNLADALGFLAVIPLVEVLEAIRGLGLGATFPIF